MNSTYVWLLMMAVGSAHALNEPEKFQFKAADIKEASIHNSTGNLNIAPTATKTAYVILNKLKWGPRCQANVDIKEGKLSVEIDDSSWILDHECRVDLIISLPSKTPLEIRNGTGDVTILANQSKVDVKVGTGLTSIKGDLTQLSALSASGDIRMNGSAETAEVKTGSGDIELQYNGLPKSGKLQAKTGSGDVQLFLPATARVNPSISTGSGSVINDFLQDQEGPTEFAVEASSGSGDIQIRKK
jgi:DUF4097 and DUF4098 domain-containing protein YvlB